MVALRVFWQAKVGGSAAPAPATDNNGKFNIQTYNAISPVGLEKYDTVSARHPILPLIVLRLNKTTMEGPTCRTDVTAGKRSTSTPVASVRR